MGIKTVLDTDGKKMLTWVETTENIYWRETWRNAWNVMPRHSATMLCHLLGYRVPEPRKIIYESGAVYYPSNGANSRIHANMARGSKPKKPQQQRLLQMLAGPHGETIAKAIAIQRGIKFK